MPHNVLNQITSFLEGYDGLCRHDAPLMRQKVEFLGGVAGVPLQLVQEGVHHGLAQGSTAVLLVQTQQNGCLLEDLLRRGGLHGTQFSRGLTILLLLACRVGHRCIRDPNLLGQGIDEQQLCHHGGGIVVTRTWHLCHHMSEHMIVELDGIETECIQQQQRVEWECHVQHLDGVCCIPCPRFL